MDAAQKLFKHSRHFLALVVALLLSAPGWAFDAPSFNVSPSQVTLSGTNPGVGVNVGSSGAAIKFSVSQPDYSSDPTCPQFACNWLRATPEGTTTPTVVDLNLFQTGGLTPAVHTAKVTLTATDGSGAAPAVITVTYNSQAGTGGNAVLTSSVNPISLAAATNSSASVTASITTSSTTPVSIGVTSGTSSCGSSWLTASNQGNSTISSGSGTTVLVTANAAGLSTATCQGTVTITPSSGNALSIPVTFNVNGGTGGGGSLSANPNVVNLSYSTNTNNFPSQFVSITSSTNISQFNATTNCAGGWLAVNGQTNAFNQAVSSGLNVSAGSAANGLVQGSYQCIVSLADSNSPGISLNTITVNLSINGGGSSGIGISPNPVSFSSALNGSQQQTNITITNNTGSSGVLNVSASSSPGSWLSFGGSTIGQSLSAGNSTQIVVFANPSGLSASTYSGSLQITVGSQSTAVPVSLVVGGGGNPGGGTAAAAPATLTFTYQAGTAVNLVSRQSIAFSGPAGSWSAAGSTTSGGAWLTVTPSAGTLPDSNQTTVFIQPSGLAVGTYQGTVTITMIGGGTASVSVTLSVVSSAPILIPQPGSLIFSYSTGGALPAAQPVFPANNDGSTLNVTATANDSWVTVSQQSGSNSFSVSVDPTGKSTGTYTSGVTVTEASAVNSPVLLPVVLVVNGGGTGGGGTLSFSPNNMSFSSVAGSQPGSQVLSVSAANGSTPFTVAASTSSGGSWLTVQPTSATTPVNLSVSVSPSGLANGTYNGTLTFNSNSGVQTVAVTLTVSSSTGGGNVTVTCVSSCGTPAPAMSFSGQTGSGALPAGALSVVSASGSSSVSFTVTASTTSGGAWLSTSAGSSTVSTPVNPLTVNATSSPGGNPLAAGTYTGNLAITPVGGGSTVNVAVTMTLTAPPTVTATPTSLTFAYRVGDQNPAPQNITVSGGSQLAFGVTVSPSGTWLSASPTSGSTPGTVAVSINPTGLSANTYTGSVTIAGTGGALGTTTVSVTLTVTAPLPTIARVVNGASYLANAISPGEVLTLFATDAQHPIGPSTPVGLTLDSTGKVATTIGGVQVLINGFACPMIYASSTQVSAVAPYEIAPLVTASVLIKYLGQSSNGITVNVATTSPGIFTLNSSGSGPGAILNSNNSVNSPNNPANRGDTVVVYLTGEGQTSPAGVTGKVTTVSSTPPLTPGPLLPVAITVGGQPANYIFAGEAPGFVSGVMQLNVVTPTNISAGDQPIVVTIGSNSSQTGVTVSLK